MMHTFLRDFVTDITYPFVYQTITALAAILHQILKGRNIPSRWLANLIHQYEGMYAHFDKCQLLKEHRSPVPIVVATHSHSFVELTRVMLNENRVIDATKTQPPVPELRRYKNNESSLFHCCDFYFLNPCWWE